MGFTEEEVDLLAPDEAGVESPIGRAMQTLAAYYREFLETDFKKARLPKSGLKKRSIDYLGSVLP